MVLLIDGGMGQELRARGLNPDSKNAGQALIKSTEVVRDVHVEFIYAGAEIITTWNYSLTRYRLGLLGLDNKLDEMTGIAVELANEARSRVVDSQIRIAGCLPPLIASYEANDQPFDLMLEEYDEIASYLALGVDLFLCETMSSASEAAAAATAAAKFGKPVWVSWTLRDDADGLLRSGETLDEALSAISKIPVEAVLINCCDTTVVGNAIASLRSKTNHLVGGYANAFTPISEKWKRDGYHLRDLRDLTPEEYGIEVLQWSKNGAQIVGGCCGIGPEYISHLRQLIDKNVLVQNELDMFS